jgi:hypothetical protein
MSMIVLLDSEPLGLATNPKQSTEADACKSWLRGLPHAGHLPLVPMIVDYEVRRELCLYRKARGLRNLDALAASSFLPLSAAAMRLAAEYWAQLRQIGLPTADRLALDADVILCAQAASLDPASLGMHGAAVVVATGNVGHLSRLVDARPWQSIL